MESLSPADIARVFSAIALLLATFSQSAAAEVTIIFPLFLLMALSTSVLRSRLALSPSFYVHPQKQDNTLHPCRAKGFQDH